MLFWKRSISSLIFFLFVRGYSSTTRLFGGIWAICARQGTIKQIQQTVRECTRIENHNLFHNYSTDGFFFIGEMKCCVVVYLFLILIIVDRQNAQRHFKKFCYIFYVSETRKKIELGNSISYISNDHISMRIALPDDRKKLNRFLSPLNPQI